MFDFFSSSAFRRALVVCAGLLWLTGTPVLAQTTTPFFYYFEGRKVFLPLDATRVAVRFANPVTFAQQRALVDALADFGAFDARTDVPIPPVTLLPLRAGRAPFDALRDLNVRAEVAFASPVFTFPDGSRYIPTDEFVVRFRDEVSAAQRAAFNRARGAEFVRTRVGNDRVDIFRVANPKRANVFDLANAYVESGLVQYAEPNFVIQEQLAPPPPAAPASPTWSCPGVSPNDPSYDFQWHLCNYGQYNTSGAQTGVDIDATNAWNITTGNSNVIIAIIDEGVDGAHPDLSPNLTTGYNAITDTVGNTQPVISDTHGTEVAGVAAARGNNNTGVTGVCWVCTIAPIKVAYEDPPGSGYWTTTSVTLTAGIDKAWQYGADILSNSWTMNAPSSDVQGAIKDAVSYGRCASAPNPPCSSSNSGYGSTVVFAVGNEYSSTISYPAKYGSTIAVGASNWCDQPKTKTDDPQGCNFHETTWGTNYGAGLDVLAPGLQIYTTQNSMGYTWMDGTSAATPIVAGIVGLMYSLNQDQSPLLPDEIRTLIDSSADILSTTGCDSQNQCKRVNAFRALQSLYDLQVGTNDGRSVVGAGQTLQFTQYFTNTGFVNVSNATLTVTLPSGYAFVSASSGFANAGGGVYTRAVNLNVGNSGTTTMTVRVLPGAVGTSQNFVAQIAAPFGELNTTDNTATDANFVRPSFYLPILMQAP